MSTIKKFNRGVINVYLLSPLIYVRGILVENLYFVKIKEEYITYLRQFGFKVQDNSNIKNNKPYIGILIEKDNKKFFAPLSSPKEKHNIFKKLYYNNKLPIDIFLIMDKEKIIGVINFNNMIPVIEETIIYFNIKEDKNYSLLKKEYIYCIKHKEEILKKAIKVYKLVTEYNKISLMRRSCNFKLLEQKAEEYKNIISKQKCIIKSL